MAELVGNRRPPYYAMLVGGSVAIWLLLRPEPMIEDNAREEAPAEPAPAWNLTGAEWRVTAISFATSLLWVLDAVTGWPPGVPALLAMVALLMPRVGVMEPGGRSRRARRGRRRSSSRRPFPWPTR